MLRNEIENEGRSFYQVHECGGYLGVPTEPSDLWLISIGKLASILDETLNPAEGAEQKDNEKYPREASTLSFAGNLYLKIKDIHISKEI